jgi:hypothetical protein
MWIYSGPSCLDHPFYIELGDMEINTRIRGGLAHGADQNLREWVVSPWMSLLVSILASQCIHILVLDYGYAHNVPRGVTLPEDVARQEANRANNEWLWARRQRRPAWSTTRVAMRARGEKTPSELESLGGGDEEEDKDEEEGEGEVTRPPHSPPSEDLTSPGDLFS